VHAARPFRLNEPAILEFPTKAWSRVASRRMHRLSASLLSGNYRGSYPPLQAALSDYLSSSRGAKCSPEQIVVTSGVQNGLDLLSRMLIEPGTRAWIEDPGYFGAALALRNAGAKLIPVPVDEHGLSVEAGRRLARNAACVYVTPGHQFPLGVTMSVERRLALLRWATEADAFVIEDDYDSEHRFDGNPLPALQGLDSSGKVILVGTFNKLLFPTVRTGYVVLPQSLVDRFHLFRYGTDLNGTSLMQAVLCDFITEGHLGRHIRRTRALYGMRLQALLEAARRHLDGLLDMSPVRAGLYTVGRLRNGMTSAAAEAAATAAGIETMGLHRFALTNTDIQGLLLGFAAFDEQQIARAVIGLAKALDRKQAARTRG
jgi:GntR family transcriptional regulator/MocR family aminotransferase